MPFKSPKQEAFMWAKHPDIAKRWVGEYGHAEGYSSYVKNRKKGKKPGKKKASLSDAFERAARMVSDPREAAEMLKISVLLD